MGSVPRRGPVLDPEHMARITDASASRINMDSFPSLPPWALFTRTRRSNRRQIDALVRTTAVRRGDEVTQEEVDAITEHIGAIKYSQAMVSDPIQIGIAYGFWRRGKTNMRFPFFTPRALPLLGKGRSRLAWQAIRFTAYYLVTTITIGGFLDSVLGYVAMPDMAKDPRLTNVLADLRARPGLRGQEPHSTANPRSPVAAGGGPRYPQMPAQQEPPSSADSGGDAEIDRLLSQRTEEFKNMIAAKAAAAKAAADEASLDPFDDASPVAPEQRDSPSRSGARGTPPTPRGQSAWDRIRRSRAAQESQPSGSTWDQVKGGAAQDSDPSKSSWDQVRTSSPSDSPSAGTGSAWDRIRARGGSGGASSRRDPAGAGRQDKAAEEGGSYSKEEEDKAYARSQAQKEFDEMLERERQGESDESPRRRWK